MYKVMNAALADKAREDILVRLVDNDILMHKYENRVNVTPKIFQMKSIRGDGTPWINLILVDSVLGPSAIVYKRASLIPARRTHRTDFIRMYYMLFLEKVRKSATRLERELLYVMTDEEGLVEPLMDSGYKIGMAPKIDALKYKARLTL